MTFAFEVDPELEYTSDVAEVEYSSHYVGQFAEDDFEAVGVDPQRPTEAKPGSEDKVRMLAARYAAGLPLWHNDDCYDHAPNLDAQLEADDELEDF